LICLDNIKKNASEDADREAEQGIKISDSQFQKDY